MFSYFIKHFPFRTASNIYSNSCSKHFFYQGYILPFTDFGSVAWGATSSANKERLAKLQKRAARIILHAEFNTPSPFLFQGLGWLSVADRLKFKKVVLIYRVLNNQTPEYYFKTSETNV